MHTAGTSRSAADSAADPMTPWFEDPSFWHDNFARLFGAQRFDSAPAEIGALEKLVGLSPPADVLDLCCGPGQHAVELGRRGYSVTGVDLTEEYLERARQRARAGGMAVEWVRSDMRSFERRESFDMIVNLFTSFGFFEDPNDDRQVLVRAHASLRLGGVLVIDLMGKEVLARIYRERDWHEEDGVLVLEERRLSQDWSWMDNRWIAVAGGNSVEHRFSHRVYSGAELKSLLGAVGFREVSAFGSFAGAPYDQLAERLLVVARK
jgi:SAM-dependent methyltransferase